MDTEPDKPAIPQPANAEGTEASEAPIFKLAHDEFQGPIPPPVILRDYESVSPGFADRIMRMAEAEAEHRRSFERKCLQLTEQQQGNRAKEIRFGQICGLSIALTFGGLGSWVACAGHPASGATIATATVVGLVTVFVLGRRSRSEGSNETSVEQSSD